MPENIPTIATMLKEQGYHTANLGKLHFKNHSNRDHTLPHPKYDFDTLIISDEPGCYDDDYISWVKKVAPDQVENCRCSTPPCWTGKKVVKQPRNTHEPYLFEGPENLTHSAFVATKTVEFINEHKDENFFCIAGFYAPHTPLNPPKRFVDMYDPADMPLPFMNEGENKLGLSDNDWRKVKQYYYALTSHVDDQIGRIIAALEKNSILEDTIIVFTSDHGEHLGDHGRIQKGAPGLDSCAHVPLLISWPGHIGKGKRYTELIEAVDIVPTLLDCLGVPLPKQLQGRSFLPLMKGVGYKERDSAFIEFKDPFRCSWKTVRTHTHKYCVSAAGEELMFDLVKDPHELKNVIKEKGSHEALNSMREILVRRWFEVENQYPLKTGEY